MKVLHIAPHFGGGVGQVLRAMFAKFPDVGHEVNVASLEDINTTTRDFLNQNNIFYRDELENDPDQLSFLIEQADIVVVHWWNHPSLLVLLSRQLLPPARYIFWSHISGLTPPNGYCQTWLRAPETFIFTTPLSHLSSEVQIAKIDHHLKFDSVWSTSGIEELALSLKSHRERDLGFVYCGNLDFSKIHADFFKVAKSIYDKTGESILVIGPPTAAFDNKKKMMDANHCVKATGFISEEEKVDLLSRSRIFLYPLSPDHYATCDQTIQEALALGLPVLALNNLMERHMLSSSGASNLAGSVDELIEAAIQLWQDEEQQQRLSANAVSYARASFSLQHCVSKMDQIYRQKLASCEKRRLNLSVDSNKSAGDVFLQSLGYGGYVLSRLSEYSDDTPSKETKMEQLDLSMLVNMIGQAGNWTSPTKSSPFHWLGKFPDDQKLHAICERLR